MSVSRAQERLVKLKRVWAGDEPAETPWLAEGVAIEGDFAGIQSYVLKPVPGARGAAKRLRARSFRVADETQRLAESVCREFGSSSPFFVAGGRFLVCAPFQTDWKEKLTRLQVHIDQDLFKRFGGEVAFHLAAVPYQGQLVPGKALFEQHHRRRARPLEYALRSDNGWHEDEFFAAAGAFDVTGVEWGKCPACLRTMPGFRKVEDQDICEDCFDDVQLGTQLSQWRFDQDRQPKIGKEDLLHHFPKIDNQPASFDDLATQAAGKRWLGHLRIDADNIGKSFRDLNGDPARIWGLSRFMHTFFCNRVQEVIVGIYPYIYPVYGGGDDLYVIGPWDQVLDLAVALNDGFRQTTAPRGLTFSAGFALGRPHQHILTKSDEAAAALHKAKEAGRDRICALGTTLPWEEFRQIRREARDVLRWYKPGSGSAGPAKGAQYLTSAFLQNILQLTQARGSVALGLWKPLLRHQFMRNIRPGLDRARRRNPTDKVPDYCEQWVRNLVNGGGEWQRAATVVRYALLAANEAQTE